MVAVSSEANAFGLSCVPGRRGISHVKPPQDARGKAQPAHAQGASYIARHRVRAAVNLFIATIPSTWISYFAFRGATNHRSQPTPIVSVTSPC